MSVASDHRKIQLNELNELCDHAYENSLIYMEKTKRIHDSKIKNCVFNVGDQVLLFNSRLKIFLGKLKSRWSGPFTIAKVFSYGTVELSQANEPNFKVNGHRIKHYFGGDVPQLEQPPDYSFPLRFDVYPDDFLEIESDATFDDDSFDSEVEKIKEAELLIDPLDLLRDILSEACPHHGFSELHQLDTFYNALNVNDQDSLNSAAGANFLERMPADCLKIIESKSKVRQTRAKAVVAKSIVTGQKNQHSAQTSSPVPAPINTIKPSCVTYGGNHAYQNCPATSGNVYQDNTQEYVPQAAAANYGQGNTGCRPQMVANQIRPPGFPSVQNTQNNFNRGNNFNQDRGGNFIQSNFNQSQLTRPQHPSNLRLPILNLKLRFPEPVVAPVSAPMPNLKPSIPYPSRHDTKRRRDHANEQIEKFYEIFKEMSFEISFTDALILMPKFASNLKALIGNKEKLSEMA
nr:reverse transcriptase domain-containing protein [Tanacetum cinerariifolium]